MSTARVAPMPAANLEVWRTSRSKAGSPLPEASTDHHLEAISLTVDDVLVGGALLEYADDASRQRCFVRVLQSTLPRDAGAAWSSVIAALEAFVRARGVTTLTTAVAPELAGVFGAAGFRSTMTTVGKRLTPDLAPQLQQDRRVAVRPMTDDERVQFVADVGEQLRAGMARAGVADPGSLGLDDLDRRLVALAEDPAPTEMLMMGTVDGVPVGRVWATFVEDDGAVDLHGNTIDLFPEHRGQRLTPSFLGALRRYVADIGVRDVRFHLYGHDTSARRSLNEVGVGIEDVHLRKDLG